MIGLLVLACVILLAPLTLVDVPPLLDYPNHLARAVILASSDPVLGQMYQAQWGIIPNLATDLVLPPLLYVLPVHAAGRILAGAILLLPVIGIIAYSRATFRSGSLWPLASALVAYNATFLLGFLNFNAALGVALLLAAAWIAWRDRYPRRLVLLATAGAILLFFCHLMGVLCFYLLIAGYEAERLWAARIVHVAKRLAALVPLIAAPLVLYLASPLAPVAGRIEFLPPAEKAKELIYPFANYLLPLDIATGCLVVVFLLGSLAKGRCRITSGSGVTLILTTLLFLAAPWAFKETYQLDARFAILLGFLLFGALLPSGLPRPLAASAVAAFILVFAARMSIIAIAWQGHTNDLADLRAIIAAVEPGERVLAVSVTPEEAPDYWLNAPYSRRLSLGDQLDHHLPALLLIERRAYWPFLFDNPSQQPVRTLPQYRELATRTGSFTGHRELDIPGKVDLCGYQYLLLLDAGGEPDLANLAHDRLMLLTHSDIAALYRVKPSACLS